MKTILAIDQGTTGSTALIMDSALNRVAEASQDFPQHFPKPGWVEHDLNEIWKSVLTTLKEVTQKADAKKIEAIGITNQRETICFWDKKTNQALGPAIVWQDRRTDGLCRKLKEQGLEEYFQQKTGLLLDPYFSATKVAWAIHHWPLVKEAAARGTLAVGTVDSFIVSRLSGGKAHVTEPSNASRTLCFDLHLKKFDRDLCDAFGIPLDIWPQVLPSAGHFAETHGIEGLRDGIPITGILGDQQAALLGQTCFREGTAKCTYGTGAFLLLNTGKTIVQSKHRMLSTVAWALKENEYVYALEGSAFIAGAAVQWLRDGLGIIRNSEEIEPLAASVSSSEGVVFVPALTGLGAPYWDAQATGMFTGLTRGTTKGHMARAVLEGIAYMNADILNAMQKDLGKPLTLVNVDGGASANNLLMQFQADILGLNLRRPKHLETTSTGAVFAAGLGAGIWNHIEEIEKSWQEDRTFVPTFTPEKRELVTKKWKTAIERVTRNG